MYAIMCKLDTMEARNEKNFVKLEILLNDILNEVKKIDCAGGDEVITKLECLLKNQAQLRTGTNSIIDTLRQPLPAADASFSSLPLQVGPLECIPDPS